MGAPVYVHDLDLPGMVHARVVRPAGPGMRLVDARFLPKSKRCPASSRSCATATSSASSPSAKSRRSAPRGGSRASRSGKAAARCRAPTRATSSRARPRTKSSARKATATPRSRRASRSPPNTRRPHIAHAALGPSCALAEFRDGRYTSVDAQPGDLPAARRPRDGARRCRERHRDRAHGRRRLLRPQRRGRRRLRRGAARARVARAGRCACSGCARTNSAGSRSARRWSCACRPTLDAAGQHRELDATTCGATATRTRPGGRGGVNLRGAWDLAQPVEARGPRQSAAARRAAATATRFRSTTFRASA